MNFDLKNLQFFKWKLIVYQKADSEPFSKGDELFYRSTDGSKLSLLGTLNERYKCKDFYEFFLEYEYESHNPIFLYWKQKSNPLEAEPSSSDIGFVKIYVPEFPSNPFQGLAKSGDTKHCFLDGTLGTNTDDWWFGIICYTFRYDKIPGPRIVDDEDSVISADSVSLWVRVPFSIYNEKIDKQKSFHVFTLILLIN